jgi:peptidyl-prolyl cis-trans isomerase SurA
MGPDTEAGSEIYIVCDRKDDQGIQISREAISDNIFGQRLAMMARRHLRDLRREAVVEYR